VGPAQPVPLTAEAWSDIREATWLPRRLEHRAPDAVFFLQIPTACWPAYPLRSRALDHAALHPGTLRDCSLLFAVLHDALLHDLS
jgi:hypothetical protein